MWYNVINNRKESTAAGCYQHPTAHAGELTTGMTGFPASTAVVYPFSARDARGNLSYPDTIRGVVQVSEPARRFFLL